MNLGNIFRHKVSATTTVSLTEAGKAMAEKYLSRGPTFKVLSALAERSPMTVSELAMETEIELSEAKTRINTLIKQGMVRATGNED